jgi:hypothetical protein
LSARAKWVACVAAFAVGGLVAAIPAFLDRPVSRRAAQYEWTGKLPLVAQGYGSFTAEARPVATVGDGRQLLAVRQAGPAGDAVCLEYGSFSAGCMPPDRRHQIQLFARLHDSEATSWVGILAGDVAALRVIHPDGSTDEIKARHGFVVRGDRFFSLVALDAGGDELESVAANAPVAVECDDTGCTSMISFSADG